MINNNSDEWVCYHCGFRNPYTLRVALKDICIKCRSEKQSSDIEHLETEYTFKMNEIDRAIESLKQKAMPIQADINSLNSEISDLRAKLKYIDDEYRGWMEEKRELETKHGKHNGGKTVGGKRIMIGQRELMR